MPSRSRTRTRSRTIELSPYSVDLQALRDREKPGPAPIPGPPATDETDPCRDLEDRVARAQSRGWEEDRYWATCMHRPAGQRWMEERGVVYHVSPERYFRERLDQSISITSTLVAVGRSDLEASTQNAIVEELLDTYETDLGRCLLPLELLAAVARAGLDLASRSSRFYDVAERLEGILVGGESRSDWSSRRICRLWALELATDGHITDVQAATLELLVDVLILQDAEARDLEAAREMTAEPGELPGAIAELRRSGDAEGPVLAQRLTDEGMPAEVEGIRGAEAERVNERLESFREEGICPAPPVFTG